MSNAKMERAEASLKNLKKLGAVDGIEKLENEIAKKRKRKPRVYDYVTKLKDWHKQAIREVILFGYEKTEVALKYNKTIDSVNKLLGSKIAQEFAVQILSRPDLELVRNKLKILDAYGYKVIEEIFKGHEVGIVNGVNGDGIGKLERGKFILDVMKVTGVPDAKELNIHIDTVFKTLGEAIGEAARTIETTISDVVEAEIIDKAKKIAYEEEKDGDS